MRLFGPDAPSRHPAQNNRSWQAARAARTILVAGRATPLPILDRSRQFRRWQLAPLLPPLDMLRLGSGGGDGEHRNGARLV